MNLSRLRSMFEEGGRSHRQQGWDGFQPSNNQDEDELGPSPSISVCTEQSEDDLRHELMRSLVPPTDAEMLDRARAACSTKNFAGMAAGPGWGGPWKRVEAANDFVVFKQAPDNNGKSFEVLCAGRLDASLQEVASILRSSSEAEHNVVMEGLYSKSFIFGSFERNVPCAGDAKAEKPNPAVDSGEQLAVKTKSFARTGMFSHNEQWCYFDYFLRKKERDGFTISKRALPRWEATPGRIVGANSRVDQLHGLNASYLVEKLPNKKGLRVVFHAWFDEREDLRPSSQSTTSRNSNRRQSSSSTSSSSSSTSAYANAYDYGDANKQKSQLRRLLALAHGVTKLPDVIRRRRFGVQIPINPNASYASNSRCPCCTHSLAPVKMSFSMAASAIANRSLSNLRMDTRRCYLCGYLVCIDCWSGEHIESATGRVAAIVVCTRCRANVQACEYAEVFAGTAAEREKHRGAARVVPDSNDTPTVSLLVDFLSASLLNTTADSSEHAAVMRVIRTLLRQEEEVAEKYCSEGDESDGNQDEFERANPRFELLDDATALNMVSEMLADEQRQPSLDDCTLANADMRDYQLDLHEDPSEIPGVPMPKNEVARVDTINDNGLMLLAESVAPITPAADIAELERNAPNVKDLDLICQLVVKTLGCGDAFVTLMSSNIEHIIAATHPGFLHAAVPRNQTTCQHTLMSLQPLLVAHHEADVRFHSHAPVSTVPIRFYIGFPLRMVSASGEEVAVGTLCCIDSQPRAEINRTQYATIKRLANIAIQFMLQKAHRLQDEQRLALENGNH